MVIFISMKQNFGEWLKEILDKQKINQSELAAMTGVLPAQISRIISGERGTTPEMLDKIAHALKLPPKQVFEAAGWLNETPKKDKMIEQIEHMYSELPDDDKAEILEFVKWRTRAAEEKARHKNRIE